jgi:hypothetical protein
VATDRAQEREMLYALDEPVVMIPYESAANASKAKYRGWQELDAVGMVDCVFDPRRVWAHVRWMFRFTADPFSEITHRYGDAMTPGAYKVWKVEVLP